jgi:prepilin-type N-terminal cleavage/methylation domain-containing protein
MRRQHGFTLIEIAIVLVIIGLLLGGVLKGQELITSARVRNLISQQDGIKAAYFGFQDRFRAWPGDYSQATLNINQATANGNGDGQIIAGAAAPVPALLGFQPNEDISVWEHLSRAGFINGAFTYNAAYAAGSAAVNPYSSFLILRADNAYLDPNAAIPVRHNLRTGSQVPADILAEIDRKIDDGSPLTGTFRFTGVSATGVAPAQATCLAGAPPIWNVLGPVDPNCAGTSLF